MASALHLQGHQGAVWGVAISAEETGEYCAATCSDDGTSVVWDMPTGEILSRLHGHTGAVYSVAWSPCGAVLCTGSADTTVRLWDSRVAGGGVATIAPYSGSVNACRFSDDGVTVLSGSWRGSLFVWDLRLLGEYSGNPPYLAKMQDSGAGVYSACFLGCDGQLLAGASCDGRVRVWCAQSGELLRESGPQESRALSVAAQPGRRRLAVGSDDGAVCVWDRQLTATQHRLEAGEAGAVTVCDLHPDGRTVVAATGRKFHAWTFSDGRVVNVLSREALSDGEIVDVRYSPGGDLLMTASTDGTARVYLTLSY